MRYTRRPRTAAMTAAALLTTAFTASTALLTGPVAGAATGLTVRASLHFPVVPIGYPATVVASVDRPAGSTVTVRLQRHRSSGWTTVASQEVLSQTTDGTAKVTFPVSTARSGNREFRVVAATTDGAVTSDPTAGRTLRVVNMRIRSVHAPGDEYAVIVNRGRVAVDLRRMKIGTEDLVATFPHRMLAPGTPLRVYTGVGTSTSSRLYLSRKGNLWRQHGTAQLTVRDTIVLARRTF